MSKGPNQDSLNTFSKIAHQCLAETQAHRPSTKIVIQELEKALDFQENRKDNLQISLADLKLATQDFNSNNLIRRARFGDVYKGEAVHANGHTTIVAQRLYRNEFPIELEILSEYKHENILDLLGYCNEMGESIIVYEHATNGSLDKYVKDASFTWTKRLKIAIDVANGLDFLHGGGVTQDVVIHRNIRSSNIMLNADWKAKISDFGVSVITPINKDIDFVIENPAVHSDPSYFKKGFLTRESDIFSLGVVLFELLCGRMAYEKDDEGNYLQFLVKRRCNEGKLDEIVFEGIREQIVPQSLITFQKIAYQCIQNKRDQRPTAKQVFQQLKNALEFQEDYEIWEAKLPRDYKEIIQLSETPDVINSVEKKKDLYDMLSKGILLLDGQLWFSLSNNGEKNEMISARMFYYGNRGSHKWRSIHKSRFQTVVKMLNISKLNIDIKTKTRFLSPNVIYGAHLVFKFCDIKLKSSSKPMYVNLKYKLERKTLHAYFARWRDDEWMMIELCRFLHYSDHMDFKVMLESFSRYYCGAGAIYVEGIEFRAIDNSNLKDYVKPEVYENLEGIQGVLESNSDYVQQLTTDYNETTKLEEGEKLLSFNKAKEKKVHMLSANMVCDDSCNVKCIEWKSLAESRSIEVAELLGRQVFRIKGKIEAQKLSSNTDYGCYILFKLSEKCNGLQCPVKVRDVLLRKNKETKFIYFRSPNAINLHDLERVPKVREDGLMEVMIWEFNSSNKINDDHHIHMHLKLRCYEGTMCGLVVYGIEFRAL